MIRILTLVENQTGARKGLEAEHGLSFVVDVDGVRILFDCGAGRAAAKNCRLLNVAPASVDVTVLSHSHYDHAAGLPFLAERGLWAETVIGEHFFEEKYGAGEGGTFAYLGCGFDEDSLGTWAPSVTVNGRTVRLTARCTAETGFPRRFSWETIPARFVKRTAQGLVPDDFADEQCLVLELKDGLALVAGCSHPGILNMVTEVGARYERPVTAVIGGIHLKGSGEERIRNTVQELKAAGVRRMWCNHCSGAEAEKIMREDPEICCGHLGAGDCLFLE